MEWNSVDTTITNAGSNSAFKNIILKFFRHLQTLFITSKILKVLNLLLGYPPCLSHLRERKIKNSFEDLLNTMYHCGRAVESTLHFLLYCPAFTTERQILLSILNNTDQKLLEN